MSKFVAKLIERQGSASSNAFARMLGTDPANWCKVRQGKRPPSRRLQQAALSRWPELAYYLAEDAKVSQAPPAA